MNKHRLLLVEDSTDQTELIKVFLSKSEPPFQVEAVETAELCQEALAKNQYDALLLDYDLPGMNGLELLQCKLSELFAPDLNDQVNAFAEQAIILGYLQDDRLTLQTADGRLLPVDVSASLVDMGDERLLQMIMREVAEKRQLEQQIRASKMRLQALFDSIPDCISVTEQKRFEKQLIQSEKLATIGLLSSGVAHELRNPLNTIDTARYYLAGLPQLQDPQIKDKLDIIQKNVRRASSIINNLLEFSRYSEREREAIDINKLLDSTLILIGKELSTKNIKIVKRYQNLPMAFFNTDGLKQVFLNLIINAVQAMPSSGTLTIATARDNGKTILVEIADTGVGISKENMQHIFSPFFTTKAIGEGTGLGLYISHTIIERDGGKITVESEPGKGSTFCVQLPVDSKLTRSNGGK